MQTSLFSQIQRIMADAFAFFIGNFFQIATLCLPFLLTVVFFDLLLATATDLPPVAILARLAVEPLAYSIYMAALINLMISRAQQGRPQNADLVMRAVRQWAPFLALRMIKILINTLGILSLIIAFTNFFLFIFLSIYLLIYLNIRLVFAEYHLVLFNISPIESIKRSFKDTRNNFWLLFIIVMLISIPITIIFSMLVGDDPQILITNNKLLISLKGLFSVMVIFVRIALFRAFMDVVTESR